MRQYAAPLLALVLAGCAATPGPAGDARETLLTDYLTLRDQAAVAVFRYRQACEAGQIPKPTCRDFEGTVAALKQKDQEVRAVLVALLRSPDQRIDQDTLGKLLEFAGAAAKVAAVAGVML